MEEYSSECTPTLYYKIIALGDRMVGKSTLLRRIVEGQKFIPDRQYTPSEGLDFMRINIGGCIYQLWDGVAIEEKIDVETTFFIIGTDIILLCYDINRQDTISSIEGIYNNLRSAMGKQLDGIGLILVGLKRDHPHRQVSTEDGEKLALKLGIMHMEYSSLKDDVAIVIKKIEEAIEKSNF